jgi:hypothetical protein
LAEATYGGGEGPAGLLVTVYNRGIGDETNCGRDLGMLVFVADVPKGGILIIGSGYVGTTVNSPLGLVFCPGKKFIGMPNWGCFVGVSIADELIGSVVFGFSTLADVPI